MYLGNSKETVTAAAANAPHHQNLHGMNTRQSISTNDAIDRAPSQDLQGSQISFVNLSYPHPVCELRISMK